MIPGRLDIELYGGDSYLGPLFTLPSLVPFGGPEDLTGATITAEVRSSADASDAYPFTIQPIDLAARQIRLTLSSSDVLDLPPSGVWDLQISQGEFVGTVLSGKVKKLRQVTR